MYTEPVINISASRVDHYAKQGANHTSDAVNFQIRILRLYSEFVW